VQNLICISSYSFGQLLGPIRITRRGEDGKKTLFTWGQGEPSMSLLELPAQVKAKLGLSALEICQFHVPENTDGYIGELKDALDAAGVSLVNMPIDVGNIADPNDAYREEDLAEIESWIVAAGKLGSQLVRVNAGSPLGGHDVPVDITVASLRRLATFAADRGIGLLIENHGGRSSEPEFLIQLLETVGPPLRALLDVGNFEPQMSIGRARWQGQEPPTNLDYTPQYAAIERVTPYAGLVHAKTHEFDAAGRPTELDVARALRIVHDQGYTGPISIEYEGRNGDCWVNSQRTLDLVHEAFG
jgi:sugar phosphate isomerase/epimerase